MMALRVKSCLAFSKSVPMEDCLVTGTANDMSVVARHSATKYITGVSDKAVSGLTSVEIPQTHGVVPACGQREVVVT